MRLPAFRYSIRALMIGAAAGTVLSAGAVHALQWARLRSDRLRQAENYRLLLQDAEERLEEAEAGPADPDEQALLAESPEDQRKLWAGMVDQVRRSRAAYAVAASRWRRLADHPWERTPADLYRYD